MNNWELIAKQDRCFTIDGRHEPIDKAHFDSPTQLEILMNFKSMLYEGTQHDFMLDDKRQVSYKVTYKLEKLEGGFFK